MNRRVVDWIRFRKCGEARLDRTYKRTCSRLQSRPEMQSIASWESELGNLGSLCMILSNRRIVLSWKLPSPRYHPKEDRCTGRIVLLVHCLDVISLSLSLSLFLSSSKRLSAILKKPLKGENTAWCHGCFEFICKVTSVPQPHNIKTTTSP